MVKVSLQVVVREGAHRLSPASEDEQDILDKAAFADPNARHTCGCDESFGL